MTQIRIHSCIVLLFLLLNSCSNQPVMVTQGDTRDIYPDMIGVNGNLTQYDLPWENDSLVEIIRNLGVSNFRYPAGSLGNYWDWDRGWIDRKVPDSLMIKWVYKEGLTKSNNTYTLENFAKGQKNLGFTPVFMLNMLSKDLDHSLRNLLKAKDLGLPIKYIELGNELYFNLDYEMSVYPTPEDYGKTCKIWIDSLKIHFPNAKYAIIGSYIKRRKRHIDWTKRALQYCTNADALTFHKYSPAGIDGQLENKRISAGKEGLSDEMTATRKNQHTKLIDIQKWEIQLLKNDSAYANFLTSAEKSAKYYTEIDAPKTMEIWATEFNMRDDQSALRGTWANAFHVSKYYEVFLNSPVTLTNIHNVGGNLFGQFYSDKNQLDYIKWKTIQPKPYTLTPGGIATSLYSEASKGMNSVSYLNFSEIPTLINDRGDRTNILAGWLFQSDQNSKMMLINYGRKPIELNMENFSDFQQSTTYSAAPDLYITGGLSDLQVYHRKFDNSLILQPFSMTIIK